MSSLYLPNHSTGGGGGIHEQHLRVVRARLCRSTSGPLAPHQTGPVPRLLGVLAEAHPVGRGRAELARAGEQLVLPLQGRWDDVEEDDRPPHGLPENVLGSAEGKGERMLGVRLTEMNCFHMIRDTSAIMCYHGLRDGAG